MSGRDYKSFIFNHRTGDVDKLVRRMTDGVGSNKYDHHVDYARLKALANEKKYSGHKTLMKVQKIEKLSKLTKENNLLKQQRMVWQKEFLHLNHQRKRVQQEMDVHLRENCLSQSCRHPYQEFQYEAAGLEREFEKFKMETAEPVWNLRDDLTYWLRENRDDLRTGVPEVIEHHADIMGTIASVKQQQADILEKLDNQQMCLEQELNSNALLDLCPPQLEKRPRFQEGIPPEAYDLECPDEKLKISVLEEFLILDQKYYARIRDLEKRHRRALMSDNVGGWDDGDHFMFISVIDQYPSELQNRRKLLMDRLKRQLPHMSRAELLEHEDWWLDFKHFNERHKGILTDWVRDRRELLTKARVVFAEAMAAQELEEVKDTNRQRQIEICNVLYERVREWREQKLEVMQLEMELERQRLERAREHEEMERQVEEHRRQKEKYKISRFQEERAEQRRRDEAANQRRLDELQAALAEQAVFDKERVKYREEQLQRRREEWEREEEEQRHLEEEKERRLEALREQVRPLVENDPERVCKQTEAWQARLKEEEEGDEMLQKPLFEINTFTSKQVTSDPRVRLEQKLRDAGLHQSDYARQIMAKVKPAHPPRRDMESTVFKQD